MSSEDSYSVPFDDDGNIDWAALRGSGDTPRRGVRRRAPARPRADVDERIDWDKVFLDGDPASRAPDEGLTIEEFAKRHDLLTDCLPFHYRGNDPIETMRALREFFDQLPRTCQSWTLRDLSNTGIIENANTHNVVLPTFLTICGSWKLPNDSTRPTRWVNPNYVHLHAVADCAAPENQAAPLDRRREVAREVARVGIFSRKDLRERFGCSENAMSRYFTKYDIPWKEMREAGRHRAQRTWATTHAWTDHTYDDIAEAWGVPRGTVARGIHDARKRGFVAPNDPTTGRQPYAASNGGN